MSKTIVFPSLEIQACKPFEVFGQLITSQSIWPWPIQLNSLASLSLVHQDLLFHNSHASDAGLVSLERENLLLGDDRVKLHFGHFSCDGERHVVDENDVVGAAVERDAEVDGGRAGRVKIDSTVKPDGVVFP